MKKQLLLILLCAVLFVGNSYLTDWVEAISNVTIPADGRLFWTKDNSGVDGIPSGFTRDTNFDDRYLQGSDHTFTGDANGGAETHTHTLASHDHGETPHTHVLTSDSQTAGSVNIIGGTQSRLPPATHAHDVGTNYPTAQSGFGSATITLDGEETKPASIRLIIIQPDDANQTIPDDCSLFYYTATPPDLFSIADGTGGTVDMDGNHVIGALTDGDAGGTFGSSIQHDHTQTGSGHRHSAGTHNHGNANSSQQSGAVTNSNRTVAGLSCRVWGHHRVPSNNATSPDTTYNDDNTDNFLSTGPLTTRLLPIQNTAGSAREVVKGMIIPFVGAYEDIPIGWSLCDGKAHPAVPTTSNHQIQGNSSNVGEIFGRNSHIHGINNHKHSESASHNHTPGTVTFIGATARNAGITAIVNATHVHNWTISSTTPDDLSPDTQVTMAGDMRYKYRTVMWIQYTGEGTVHVKGLHILGGALLLISRIGIGLCLFLLIPCAPIRMFSC